MQNNIELPWRPVDSRGLARSCCPMLSSLYVYNISNTDFMIATYFNSLFVSSVSSQFNYRSCNRHHHQSIYQSIINQSSSINHHQSINQSIIICKYSSIMFLFISLCMYSRFEASYQISCIIINRSTNFGLSAVY